MYKKFFNLISLLLLIMCSCASLYSWRDIPEISVSHTTSPPVIDGNVEQKEWQEAAKIQGLKPAIGGTYQNKIDKVPTEVRILWSKDFLFIAFICIDDDIFSTMSNHDDLLYKEDVCEIFIDPFGDGKQYIEIQVSPNNVVLDKMFVLSAEPEYTKNLRMQPGFTDMWGFLEWNLKDLKTATAPLMKNGKKIGWTTEIAIPAKELTKRYGKKKLFPTTMRANFMRYDYQSNKKGKKSMVHMNWTPVQYGCPHISPAAMGYMHLKDTSLAR